MIRWALAGIGATVLVWLVWSWAKVSTERWIEQNRYERQNPYG